MTNSNHLTHGFHQASGGGASPEELDPTTGIEPTVRASHGLACPGCGRDDWLIVSGHKSIMLEPGRYVGLCSYHITERCEIMCMGCGASGTVAEFRVSPGQEIMIYD